VLVVVTRGEAGGAQVHVRELIAGLRSEVEFTLAVGDDEWLAGQVRELGVPVHVLGALQRDVAAGADVRALGALRALAGRVSPDLVHTHSTKAGLLGRIAARTMGIPAIHTAHAWSFSDGIPWSRKAWAIPVEAAAGRITRRFIVVSEADGEVALRWRVARAGQVRVVHNGVADVPERSRPEQAGPPVLTMVARMAAPKDHLLLLRALSGIDAPFRLQLVGDGPNRRMIEAAVLARRLQDRVCFVGMSLDVPRLLAGSHVGVLVSRQEGFPLVVLEAMRAGLPVVASDVGGIREAVQAGRTGVLVPRGDEASLRSALKRLIEDGALRRTMGDAGRARWEARFTARAMLAGTAAVYAEVASL
jgi:glycosyltransferase involved in cell wall biosynthesis